MQHRTCMLLVGLLVWCSCCVAPALSSDPWDSNVAGRRPTEPPHPPEAPAQPRSQSPPQQSPCPQDQREDEDRDEGREGHGRNSGVMMNRDASSGNHTFVYVGVALGGVAICAVVSFILVRVYRSAPATSSNARQPDHHVAAVRVDPPTIKEHLDGNQLPQQGWVLSSSSVVVDGVLVNPIKSGTDAADGVEEVFGTPEALNHQSIDHTAAVEVTYLPNAVVEPSSSK